MNLYESGEFVKYRWQNGDKYWEDLPWGRVVSTGKQRGYYRLNIFDNGKIITKDIPQKSCIRFRPSEEMLAAWGIASMKK